MTPDSSSEQLMLARLPSGTEVTTHLHTFTGTNDGPTVYIQAAVHGREINGVEVIRRVCEILSTKEIHGEVRLVPVANPLTFDLQRYTLPHVLDHTHLWTANMERTWPGDTSGSLHERMAATLWEHVAGVDAVVDLHTGSQDTHPHSVYTKGQPAARELAEAFGTDLVMPSGIGPRAPDWPTDREVAGTLRAIASDAGIPSMIAELGDAHRIDTDVVSLGVTGVLNVLRELGVLKEPEEENGAGRLVVSPMHDNKTDALTAANSGLFVTDSDIELGKEVGADERLGTLYHPTTFERIDTVTAQRAGYLYYLRKRGTVTGGERLAGIAIEQS